MGTGTRTLLCVSDRIPVYNAISQLRTNGTTLEVIPAISSNAIRGILDRNGAARRPGVTFRFEEALLPHSEEISIEHHAPLLEGAFRRGGFHGIVVSDRDGSALPILTRIPAEWQNNTIVLLKNRGAEKSIKAIGFRTVTLVVPDAFEVAVKDALNWPR